MVHKRLVCMNMKLLVGQSDCSGCLCLPTFCRPLSVPSSPKGLAQEKGFEVAGYDLKHLTLPEQTRAPRVVRIGAIQNAIVLPTDRPVIEQVWYIVFVSLLLNTYLV